MTRLNLLVVQSFIAAMFSRLNVAQMFSFFAVIALVGMVSLTSPDAFATVADVKTKVDTFQADVVDLLGNILTAVIAIGSAAIVIFIANTALRWLRAAA